MTDTQTAIELRLSIRRLLTRALPGMRTHGSIRATKAWIDRVNREVAELKQIEKLSLR